MKLTKKAFARFQTFEEVHDMIDILWRLAGSREQQDFFPTLLILRCYVTLVLVYNKT